MRNDGNGYLDKGKDFGLLLGTEYIQRIINENGFQYPKTPHTIAVIPDDATQFTIFLDRSFDAVLISSRDFSIKAKIVNSDHCLPTEEQAKEFIQTVKQTGYMDLHDSNIFLTSEGAQFVDTELRNFRGVGSMEYEKLLTRFNLPPGAETYLQEKLHKPSGKGPTQMQIETWEKERRDRQKMLKNAGLRKRDLKFPVVELLASEPSTVQKVPQSKL
jgi:hypothetical protein